MHKSLKLPVAPEVVDIICNKYHVLEFVIIVEHDIDPESLASTLEKYISYNFDCQERLVVCHFDTDYYPSLTCVGNSIYNFFRLCANFNIPLDRVIFLTNHVGIEKEINTVSQNICNFTDVKVVYTHQWLDYPDVDQTSNNDPEAELTHLYSCLNGQQRMHRMLTLCMLKEHDLLDKGIISYNFGN